MTRSLFDRRPTTSLQAVRYVKSQHLSPPPWPSILQWEPSSLVTSTYNEYHQRSVAERHNMYTWTIQYISQRPPDSLSNERGHHWPQYVVQYRRDINTQLDDHSPCSLPLKQAFSVCQLFCMFFDHYCTCLGPPLIEEKLSYLISRLKRYAIYRLRRRRGASTRTWYIFQKPMNILMVRCNFCLRIVPVIHWILHAALLVLCRFTASHRFGHVSKMAWQRPSWSWRILLSPR